MKRSNAIDQLVAFTRARINVVTHVSIQSWNVSESAKDDLKDCANWKIIEEIGQKICFEYLHRKCVVHNVNIHCLFFFCSVLILFCTFWYIFGAVNIIITIIINHMDLCTCNAEKHSTNKIMFHFFDYKEFVRKLRSSLNIIWKTVNSYCGNLFILLFPIFWWEQTKRLQRRLRRREKNIQNLNKQ